MLEEAHGDVTWSLPSGGDKVARRLSKIIAQKEEEQQRIADRG